MYSGTFSSRSNFKNWWKQHWYPPCLGRDFSFCNAFLSCCLLKPLIFVMILSSRYPQSVGSCRHWCARIPSRIFLILEFFHGCHWSLKERKKHLRFVWSSTPHGGGHILGVLWVVQQQRKSYFVSTFCSVGVLT